MKTLEEHLDCEVFLRGNVLTLDGDDDAVAMAPHRRPRDDRPGRARATRSRPGRSRRSPARSTATRARAGSSRTWSGATAGCGSRRRPSTRSATSTRSAARRSRSAVGPAGTGKSFLAVAMAVAALSRREVNRIVLTRPAVEAGERLGFLPGDIAAKVDPYLRPLFDALYDMLEPEKVNQHLERGVIEVAPLAFMRGRAQPLDRQVLTPYGFRAIGSLRVGDVVIGSDGLRTAGARCLPPGPSARYSGCGRRMARQTVCCAEHLWFVTTPGRPQSRQGRPRPPDAGDDRAPAPASPAPIRAADRRAGRARAAGRPDRPIRPRPAARRRLHHDLDDSLVHHEGPRARRGAWRRRCPGSSSVARTRWTTRSAIATAIGAA